MLRAYIRSYANLARFQHSPRSPHSPHQINRRTSNPAFDGRGEEIEALFAEAQAAKAFVNESASRIVDRALAFSGGGGYVNGSALARAYRDVKAGSVMHPLGANRAYDYLGHLALGEETSLH